MKLNVSSLGIAALLLVALGVAVANTSAPIPSAAPAVDSGQLLAGASDDAVCNAPQESIGLDATAPFELAAVGPHCCGSGASAACRDSCKLQGPGCKGTIGCRAGECVCTCSCP